MNAREKDLLARHCLLNLDEITGIWHRKEWNKLAVVVRYARDGVPKELSKTDPYEYRRLCAGLAEYHIRGFDGFDLDSVEVLARSETQTTEALAA